MPVFTIERDDDAFSPREDGDNLAVMACLHSRYLLGDPQAETTLREQVMAHPDFDANVHDTDNFISLHQAGLSLGLFAAHLPLYLYDHSGITLSTTPFSCPFDSGQVGFIYMTHETVKAHFGTDDAAIQKAHACLASEVAVYDQYIRGEATCYTITDDDGNVLESCAGFYGDDIESNGMLEHIPAQYHALARMSA